MRGNKAASRQPGGPCTRGLAALIHSLIWPGPSPATHHECVRSGVPDGVKQQVTATQGHGSFVPPATRGSSTYGNPCPSATAGFRTGPSLSSRRGWDAPRGIAAGRDRSPPPWIHSSVPRPGLTPLHRALCQSVIHTWHVRRCPTGASCRAPTQAAAAAAAATKGPACSSASSTREPCGFPWRNTVYQSNTSAAEPAHRAAQRPSRHSSCTRRTGAGEHRCGRGEPRQELRSSGTGTQQSATVHGYRGAPWPSSLAPEVLRT